LIWSAHPPPVTSPAWPCSPTGSQLGSPAGITIRPATDPAGLGLNIAFAGIPDTYDGTSISIQEINSTFDSLRFP